jgi:hypothetical protein
MRNEDKSLSRVVTDDSLQGGHGSDADLLQTFSPGKFNTMGFLPPQPIALGILFFDFLVGMPFPISKTHVNDASQRLDLQRTRHGNLFGCLPGPSQRA